METLEWLSDPMLRSMIMPGVIGGLAVVVACAVLSVLVVLKRLGFVGQGVSHSAFGGIGVAAILGCLGQAATQAALSDPGSASATGGGLSWLLSSGIVLGFCILSALGMGVLSDRKGIREDTAIGVFLVASMALGGMLISLSIRHGKLSGSTGYESILFGQILAVSWGEAWAAVVASGVVLVTLWIMRRPMFFWAFDEVSASAFGVPALVMKLTLMVLLCFAIVTAMKIVGVVLATALLVLPGATALRLSDRLRPVLTLSVIAGVLGLIVGVVLAIELGDLPPGATIVLSLCAIFGVAWVATAGLTGRRSSNVRRAS
ncbi:MAG: metal ABC transporter permease [Pyrinomonadaceae bacterium]|nr:metal ABC transporter permease [Phycisphaerales bacterium]